MLGFPKLLSRKAESAKIRPLPNTKWHRICKWIAFRLGGSTLACVEDSRIDVVFKQSKKGKVLGSHPLAANANENSFFVATINFPDLFKRTGKKDTKPLLLETWTEQQAEVVAMAMLVHEPNHQYGLGMFELPDEHSDPRRHLTFKKALPHPKSEEELLMFVDLDLGGSEDMNGDTSDKANT